MFNRYLREMKINENRSGWKRLSQKEMQVKLGRMPGLWQRRSKGSWKRIEDPVGRQDCVHVEICKAVKKKWKLANTVPSIGPYLKEALNKNKNENRSWALIKH
jgi:hypothetical protein